LTDLILLDQNLNLSRVAGENWLDERPATLRLSAFSGIAQGRPYLRRPAVGKVEPVLNPSLFFKKTSKINDKKSCLLQDFLEEKKGER